MAKMQREKMWRRYLIIGTIVVVVLVIGILLYGLVLQNLIQARQPVAKVGEVNILTSQWQDRVRFQRANLINSAASTIQFAQAFTDPSFQSSFASQLQQIKAQLEPVGVGQQTIDSMVEEIIIQKEAEKRGILVSSEDVRRLFEETFGYFPNGTPTPEPTFEVLPTSTLSSLQMTLIPPTATPLPTAVITATQEITPTAIPTATLTPLPTATAAPTQQPTATPNTVEGLESYKNAIENFDVSFGLNESKFRSLVDQILRAQLYRDRLEESVLNELEVTPTQQQVWARHILVEDEAQAKELYDRLQNNEDFCKLAAEFSTDESNKFSCGDLGWFGAGKMVQEFEEAALALKIGEISLPVKSQFGYHIIQSLGNEERPLDQSTYQSEQTTKFQEWLDSRKAEYQVEVLEDRWPNRVPTEPAWPLTFDQFIEQLQQQQQQQLLTPVPSTPSP
jgi:parvulin-like peptidyl-prolyl isomerase